ncbi:hypothetical protein FRC10_003587 [Ceratobasidium sp. 414]|nr:hypothetical protein FRC10_003587 [Ceratobasidium sp. 414]
MRGLPFTLLPASRPSSRPSSPPPIDPYESSASEYDIPTRRGFVAYAETPGLLFPPSHHFSTAASASSSRSTTPLPSRTTTPVPSRPTTPTFGSVYGSTEDDTEDDGPLLPRRTRRGWWTPGSHRSIRSRRKRDPLYGMHGWRRLLMAIVRHPLFPTQISSILLALLLFSLFALAVTLLLMHVLNPDKYMLPWRSYCSLAPAFPPKAASSSLQPSLEALPPAGVFVGVMSMDSAFERRQLIRSTWASHESSRGGASGKQGLNSTSRTVVRFILGQPRKDWERRIKLEHQLYNDLVILPIKENMNNGKTHAYFTWAHSNALVPPPLLLTSPPDLPGYENYTIPNHSSGLVPPWYRLYATDQEGKIRRGPAPDKLALHDPLPVAPMLEQTSAPLARRSAFSRFPKHITATQNLFPRSTHGHIPRSPSPEWVRPDYVVKADDDSFVMLAELEARLRWELWGAKRDADADAGNGGEGKKEPGRTTTSRSVPDTATSSTEDSSSSTTPHSEPIETSMSPTTMQKREYPEGMILDRRDWVHAKASVDDPLIYWGYLVKSRFMAGELYALSSALVEYVATAPALKGMTRGAEDKQARYKPVAAWMKAHPHAASIRWRSERCWVYDHPKAGTVYSHGFLFPSEAARVKYQTTHGLTPAEIIHLPTSYLVDDPVMSHSTVSRFGIRYSLPGGFSNFTVPMEIEALVEGSALSRIGTMPPPASQKPPQTATSDAESSPSSDPQTPPSNPQTPPGDDSLVSPHTDPKWPDVLAAYAAREGRRIRYAGNRVGGTVVVHYIKKNEWFLEAALALLGGEDEVEGSLSGSA